MSPKPRYLLVCFTCLLTLTSFMGRPQKNEIDMFSDVKRTEKTLQDLWEFPYIISQRLISGYSHAMQCQISLFL
jgi:hypothetical protein